MTEIISTRIPDDIAKDLKEIEKEEKTDRATLVRKLLARAIEQWKVERALRLYREGKVTLWRAAKLGGITLREMMELAAKQGIQFKYTSKDLEEDIKAALTE
jgi:predicted HTH domain antitoxin